MEDMMLQRTRLMNYQTAKRKSTRSPVSEAEYERQAAQMHEARKQYAAAYDREVRGRFQGQTDFQPVANGIDHVMVYNLDGSNTVLAKNDISNGRMSSAVVSPVRSAGMEAEPMESADEIAAQAASAGVRNEPVKSPWLEPELVEVTGRIG